MSKFSKKFMGRSPFNLSDSTRNAMATAGTKGAQKAAMMVAKTKKNDAIVEEVDKLGEKIKEAKTAKDEASPAKKTKADRIRGRKGGTVKNVTERLDEGDYKSARLERRGNVASSKGKKSKAQRLRRKADESSQRFFEKQVERRKEK